MLTSSIKSLVEAIGRLRSDKERRACPRGPQEACQAPQGAISHRVRPLAGPMINSAHCAVLVREAGGGSTGHLGGHVLDKPRNAARLFLPTRYLPTLAPAHAPGSG